jgi:hypothetical protein
MFQHLHISGCWGDAVYQKTFNLYSNVAQDHTHKPLPNIYV